MFKYMFAFFLSGILPFSLMAKDVRPLFRATMDVGESSYVIDIDPINDGEVIIREINISCISACAGSKPYSQKVVYNPIYMMTPTDDSDHVITVWTTGDSYRVMVFKVGDKVSRVFVASSRSAPEISFSKSGNDQLRLCNDGDCKIYRWGDGKYTEI